MRCRELRRGRDFAMLFSGHCPPYDPASRRAGTRVMIVIIVMRTCVQVFVCTLCRVYSVRVQTCARARLVYFGVFVCVWN